MDKNKELVIVEDLDSNADPYDSYDFATGGLGSMLLNKPKFVRTEPCGCRRYSDGSLQYVGGHSHD